MLDVGCSMFPRVHGEGQGEGERVAQILVLSAHADFASSAMKSFITVMAMPTSSLAADSAGLWLIPPWQRTNNIATGATAAMAAASWPAPLARNGDSFW